MDTGVAQPAAKYFLCDDEKIANPRAHFKEHGWCVISTFCFPEGAERMRDYLLSHLMPRQEWYHASQNGYEPGTQYVQAVPKNFPKIVENRTRAGERTGKSLHYSFTRTMLGPDTTNVTFRQFYDMIGSERFLSTMCAITGLPIERIETLFASKYETGDFLDPHTDAADESRQIAFVLNLTKDWKEEYGGNLVVDSNKRPDGSRPPATIVTPAFNSLAIFDVTNGGRLHYVSQVTPATDDTRVAITGWLGKKKA